MMIARREDPDRTFENLCPGCRFLPTKPGQEPPHLTMAIYAAVELDGMPDQARVDYPDGLTAFEWTCWKALKAGRNESESRATKERNREVEEQSERSRLEELRRR
ncbi:MAG: hypothetical protein MOB07_23210 [Acidobacteria bacterium]|nr:hypothetical protein [Acidobacteriota bacterium]